MSDWVCMVPKCGFDGGTAYGLIEHLLSHKPATALDDDLRVIEGKLADLISQVQELRRNLA